MADQMFELSIVVYYSLFSLIISSRLIVTFPTIKVVHSIDF